MSIETEADAQAHVAAYRKAFEQLQAAQAEIAKLRGQWAAWQGEDSLHEMAFGEPE